MNKVVESYFQPPLDPCTCKHGRGDHGWRRVLGVWERTPEGNTRCCLCRCETYKAAQETKDGEG